ncbi:iron complex outermembrane receptor protein [Kordia periserrulae]|uniref:Iron complex outermembrane receptor protein n=1 Tax=Kordia periserrulae TaxID=701523 RepID=A0A2T6C3W7_9FLAO|nr:TonB-dependent receptor [Kordia periserrulae]PTX62983.1 iron complex outermembrane receptor protein [Kordia periserrulae]
MRTYLCMILLCSAMVAKSQDCSYTLSGKIIDLHDNTVLPGATLIMIGEGKTVESDIDGKYLFSNLCDGSYSLQVYHPNCETQIFKVKVSGNTERNFKLEHHLEELNAITLRASIFGSKTKTNFEQKVTEKQLDRFSSASLGEVLNTLSGVSSLNTGNAVVKPIINGVHSSRVVVMNNGVRMEDQEWGAEHAPSIDVNAIGNITLIKGAGALKYSGDAVGGIIVTEASKVPVKDTIYGKTNVTAATNGRGGAITSTLTKSYANGWYGSIQGTLRRFGDYEAPDYILSNTGNFERSISGRVGINRFEYGVEAYYSFFKNEIGILRASHIGGASDQVRAINSGTPLIIRDFTYDIDAPRQDVTHHLFKVRGFKNFKNLGKVTLQYDFQQNERLEFDVRRSSNDDDRASLDLALTSQTLRLDLDTDNTDLFNLKTGLMAQYQKNVADPSTGVRRLIPDYERFNLGLYGVADVSITDNFLVEVGGRFDYFHIDAQKFYRSSFWEDRNYDELFPDIVVEEFSNQILTNPKLNFSNVSATFGTRYTFNDSYKLYANYSLASRAPNPSELFSEGLHHSASRIELGDLRFDSEIAHKVSVTLQKQGKTFGFSVNPFVNFINNFIIIEPTEIRQTIRGNFQVWEYRQTKATLLGVDIDASVTFNDNWNFYHQFSLVKGYDETLDLPLIDMPPVNTMNGLVYQNKELKNLLVELQSEYTFRQNEFPDNNFQAFIPETDSFELVDVSTPPDAYHLLHLHTNADFSLSKNSTLNVGLSVTNIFDTNYRNYLNRLRYYADDLGRNISINLKITY